MTLAARLGPEDAVRRGWRRWVRAALARADDESDAYLARTPRRRADRDAAVVLVTAALALTVANFWSDASESGWLTGPLRVVGLDGVAARVDERVAGADRGELTRLAWWAGVQVGAYVALPALAIRVLLPGRVRDYGARVRGIGGHAPIYALLVALALPVVLLASFADAFQAKYPFYALVPGDPLWPGLPAWWLLYAAQFAALEFFFRGFLVLGLAPRLGALSVWVMVVPYVMLHFGKPMPEALAALVGGLVLGTLALGTRSIWWGAAVHVGIALTMDVLALWHRGILGW